MALARVQATPKGNSSAATLALTFAAPPTAGNAVVVCVASTSAAPARTACTDNKGNSYELVVQRTSSSGARTATTYVCQTVVATGSSFTVTITLGTVDGLTGVALEVGGTGGQLRVDRTVTNAAVSGLTGTTGVTAALRTTADAFAVAHAAVAQAQTSITVESVSPVWTQELEELTTGNSATPSEVDTRILTAPGGTTQSCSWTWASTAAVSAETLAIFGPATAVPNPDARATQAVVETLSHPTTIAARTTQLVVETISSTSLSHPVNAIATQLVVETISKLPPTTEGRVTQLLVETITPLPPSPGRVSQIPVELLGTRPTTARLSQSPLETAYQVAPSLVQARVSQVTLEIMYPFGCYPRPVAPGEGPRRLTRRLRRAPHVADPSRHRRIAYAKFALDLQRGVGLPTGDGADPVVTLRVSRDGGQTWGDPVTMRAGALGAYTTRVLARRLGHARDAVFEVTVSDPVAWSLVQAWLDVEPGNS